MKIVIVKEGLARGLNAVQNVISSRTTLPILSNVALKAADDKLVIEATDLDVRISCEVEAKVEKEGGITLPSKKLFGIVRELQNPEIEIEVDLEKSICSINSGASHSKIHGLPYEDFPPASGFEFYQLPPMPKSKNEKMVSITQNQLRSILKKTSYAVSLEETRYVLNGIFFKLEKEKITAVATDGRRLAKVEEESETGELPEVSFIVPTKAINELRRLLGDEGRVDIQWTDTQAAFSLMPRDTETEETKDEMWLENIRLETKLIDGTFPNYQQVIPKEGKERVGIEMEEFLSALRRAEIMTSDKSNSVKLHISENVMEITANTPEVGETRERLAIRHEGGEISIAFNPQFVMEPLKALGEGEVNIELTDELSPGVFKKGTFLYVIMPMRMS